MNVDTISQIRMKKFIETSNFMPKVLNVNASTIVQFRPLKIQIADGSQICTSDLSLFLTFMTGICRIDHTQRCQGLNIKVYLYYCQYCQVQYLYQLHKNFVTMLCIFHPLLNVINLKQYLLNCSCRTGRGEVEWWQVHGCWYSQAFC